MMKISWILVVVIAISGQEYSIDFDDLEDPTHGGWSEWNKTKCTVLCMGGYTIWTRICNNPPPSDFGAYCSGPSKKNLTCNEHVCGHPSAEEADNILFSINNISRDVTTKMWEGITLNCDGKELFNVEDYPETNITWIKDGVVFDYHFTHRNYFRVLIEPIKFHYLRWMTDVIVLENGTLQLSAKHVGQAGVWECCIKTLSNVSCTSVSVVPVIIKPHFSKGTSVAIGQNVTLRSNADRLPSLTNASKFIQLWHLDDVLRLSYVVIVPEDLTLQNASKEDEGVWTCKIYVEGINLTFPTAHEILYVIENTTFASFKQIAYEFLMEHYLLIIAPPRFADWFFEMLAIFVFFKLLYDVIAA